MNGFRRTFVTLGVVSVALMGSLTTALPAYAANVDCGDTILVSTVLNGNVGPCATGITIGADGITFDLNGFTIRGVPTAGEGPGIYGPGRTGVTVRRGIVTEFDAGVAFETGGGNTVTQMQLLNNRSTTASNFGDGILFLSSNNNFATVNLVQNNGPYAGITLLTASGNTIRANKIIDNNQSSSNTAGIRLENSGLTPSNNNIVENNLVQNSATFGIHLFPGATGNQINANKVLSNPLGGIRIFAGGSQNVLQDNIVQSNAGSFGGISVQGAAGSFPAPTNNQLLRNTATNNTPFNLVDSNANCGTNQWHGNQGPPATPPCTLNP